VDLLTRSFQQAGFPLYLVGGSVRDRLLGRTPKDLDYTTAARPERIKAILEQLGLPVYPIGEKFGTIASRIDGQDVEITTYRSDCYTPGSRHPEVRFGDSLQDDLARRDFTINAMAQDMATGELVDPFHGQHDLELQLVRAVGDPAQRFGEDPLRMLRALRFAATLDFQVEQDTYCQLAQRPALLATISRERVRDEVAKLLLGPGVGRALLQLAATGLLPQVCPTLGKLPGCLDTTKVAATNPDGDVWVHTTQVVAGIAPTLTLRLAALYHDVGKPNTRSVAEDGRTHFYSHEEVGAWMAEASLRFLHFDQATVLAVSHLVAQHMLRINYRANWLERSVRRFVHRVGAEHLEDLFALFLADMLAGGASGEELTLLAEFARRSRAVKEVLVAKSPLDGDQLIAHFQRPAGRWIGVVKAHLLQEVVDGVLAHDDLPAAFAHAERYLQDQTVLERV
jgi:poly(A) polymerase